MDNNDAPQTPIKPIILGELEFLGGCIRIKISVKNTSDLSIPEATLELKSDDNKLHFIRSEPEYPEKKGKIQLGNIDQGTSRTIAFYLDPLICENQGTDINCRLSFKDSLEIPDFIQMETLNIKMVCPIFHTDQEINIGRLKELTAGLQSKDSKVYIFPGEIELQEILKSCRDVIQLHDLKHINTFKTTDERTYESWYYGKTSATKNDFLVKCSIRKVTKSIEIKTSGSNFEEITGLLAQIGHDLTKEFVPRGKVQPVFNLHIKDYIINRSDLLDFCDHDGNCSGNIVIENIVVQRSNVASENSDKSKQSEKEEMEDKQREDERQKKIGRQRKKLDYEELLEKNKTEQSDINMMQKGTGRGEREIQVISHNKDEVKKQDTEDTEHRPGQKEPQVEDDEEKIEIIRKKSRQRIEIKTTIINKTQDLSDSGYQEERGVNFEGIGVDKLVGSLTHTCEKMFYVIDDFPIENGRLLYLASDVAGEKAYCQLTAVVREYKRLTQVLLRVISDKNYGTIGFLNDILDNMRRLVISANAREIGIISREQVTVIIDSVVQRVEEERARRKRDKQERLPEEDLKRREKEEQENKLKQKEQDEKEQDKGKEQKESKETKITEKTYREQEHMNMNELSSGKRKERLFLIMFLVMVLTSGFLVLGYWALAPFAGDPDQSLRSSPTLPGSFTNFNGMEFVLIPAGEFDMGSPVNELNRDTNEGPVHHVKIPGAFYMGKYEVTQKQWRKVMGNDPSTFKGDDQPVEQVSWNDVQEFIRKLNENEHVNKYRLPTESQWEYAARAGTSMMFSFGDNGSNLGDHAWYMGNSQGITHNVGFKKPNPFGLYDMQGNVYEWVQDTYYDSYKFPPKDGNVGDSVSSNRVFRGGSWISNAASCRPANREDADLGDRASNLGFRLVRDL